MAAAGQRPQTKAEVGAAAAVGQHQLEPRGRDGLTRAEAVVGAGEDCSPLLLRDRAEEAAAWARLLAMKPSRCYREPEEAAGLGLVLEGEAGQKSLIHCARR